MLLRQLLSSNQISANALYAWGNNASGAIGNNTQINQSTPVLISSGSVRWAKISTSSSNTLAVKSDGSLWVWGDNTRGQLAQGTQSLVVTSPVTVTGSTTWIKIAGGGGFLLAIQSDGTLWAWGSNNSGQLGDLTTTNRSSPILVSGPSGASWAVVAAGTNNSLAITTTGQLYSWGNNIFGKLGDLTTVAKSSPVLVSGPATTSWLAVSTNYYHSVGITSTGRLYAWGYNASGQLGDLTTVRKSSPILVSGPATTSWAAIAAGDGFSLGISSTGQLYAWGDNFAGSLGDLTVTNKSSPILVSGPASTSWSVIAANSGYALGITQFGRLYAWGYNFYGNLGNNNTLDRSSPILVSGPAATSWSVISTGDDGTSFAIDSQGRLYAWGNGDAGAIGNTSYLANISSPVLVSGPATTSWTAIAGLLGGLGAWALTNNNLLWGWGDNSVAWFGPLGTSSPLQIGTSSWSAVSTKEKSMFAITSTGQLYAWGNNSFGQLGDSSTIDKYSPVIVSGPAATSWAAIAAGGGFSLGISSTGQLYAWGSNSSGQLGDLTVTNKSSPILVSGPAGASWSAISAGTSHALAVATVGRLYAWGANSAGQLGILSLTNRSSPILVSGPTSTSWLAVSGGNSHSLGITALGVLYAWGSNGFGQLGDVSVVQKSSPVLVSGPAGTSWSSIAAGDSHSAGITTFGILYAWGHNTYGQLGDNTVIGKSSPILVSGPVARSWSIVAAGSLGATKAITT